MSIEQSSENNQWVESYLDALLSYGLSTEYTKKPQATDESKFDADRQLYSKYYVSQIMQMGEEGIHDAWHKATSTRHYGEKDARLEYLSWRVWFMKRNKERVRSEEGKRLAAQLLRESDDDASLHVDLDEDERVETATLASDINNKAFTRQGSVLTPAKSTRLPPISSDPEQTYTKFLAESKGKADTKDLFQGRLDGLYLTLISLHGLVRGDRMELGKDPDTGGQVKYVVELARALAQHPAVYRVDLLTRLIKDPKVDPSYGEPEECILQSDGKLGGAYIVRLAAGPSDVYLRKENLWPHLREFADRGIVHCKETLVKLAENQTPCELFAVHGHYADAGEVAAMMASTLGVDMVMTGHSLGRNKLEHLLASGTISKTEIEKTYKISRRIEAEERGLDGAMMVFTSTQQEVDEQWGLYEGYDSKLEEVLRARRRLGRYMPLMQVIPPGLDFSSLKVDLPEDPAIKEMEAMKPAFNARTTLSPSGSSANLQAMEQTGRARGGSPTHRPPSRQSTFKKQDDSADAKIWTDIFRFLQNRRKPVILAMSRPDAKKNITTLVKAFGENSYLRELANLVLVMGNRENIDSMAGGSQKVLGEVLKLIDQYDLYGSVAYPKRHQQSDISDIYRLPLKTKGVFTNVALQEPFGLTVIEAAAHGVPTVATKNGGPVDIMATLHSGLLVDPTNSKQIADACLKILTNSELWHEMSDNGVKNIMSYSWPSHCKRYLDCMELEKRFLQSKMDHGRLSGSWDHRTELPSATSGGSKLDRTPPPMSTNRLMSTPHPRPVASSSQRGAKTSPRPSKDDSELSVKSPGTIKALTQRRKHFVAVQIDGTYRMSTLVPILKRLVQEVGSSNGSVGIGLVSMIGFEDTAKLLREGGFDSEPFDWIICNSGADIWHALSKNKDGEAVWDADDQWEHHIEHRWERTPLARMITKLLSKQGSGVPQSAGTMGKTLAKALGELPEYLRGNSVVHPHHICIELDDRAKQSIDMGQRMKGAQKENLSTVVVDRIRRRLRQNGFRCHITLQMVPTEDGELHSHLHITPGRSSRALALRFLANKFGLSMEHFTVLAIPANLSEKGEAFCISTHTSDMIELISGVCKAYVNVPAKDEAVAPTKGAADRAVLDRLAITVNPTIFAQRIQLVRDLDQLAKVAQEAIESAKHTKPLRVRGVSSRSFNNLSLADA